MSRGCQVGKSIKCRGCISFRNIPSGNIQIGNNVTFGKRVTLDVHPGGKLVIGNNVNFTQDIVISCATTVTIGSDVIVAEHVSIRDADHGTNIGQAIACQPLVSLPVVIEDDVWIAAGVRVLKGALVKKGSILASNTVYLGSVSGIECGIYGGVPARLIGKREFGI